MVHFKLQLHRADLLEKKIHGRLVSAKRFNHIHQHQSGVLPVI